MTTATLVNGTRTMDNVVRPRRSLEELVDQLMAALFKVEEPAQSEQSAVRSVHEARRLRQAGDIDGALAVLAGVDTAKTAQRESRWAFSEWTQLVKRRFVGRGVLVYSQATGRPPRWCPGATAGRWRSRRSWGCAGGRGRSSRSAASGGCGP